MENKMEEELLKEENKKDNILIIAGIISLIVIVVVMIFYHKNKNDDIKPTENDTTISDDISTKSDDIEKNNTEKKGDTIYIYAKGYADMAPIAFTYDCKSQNCNIITTEKGIVLYDDNKVSYRELTQYEYDQIYNQEISPIGSKLDVEGFEEIERLLNDEKDNYVEENIYSINDELFILTDNSHYNQIGIYTYDEYRKKGYTYVTSIDNLVLFDGNLYDYINKKIIEYYGETKFSTSDYGKIGKTYYFKTYASSCPCDENIIYDSITNKFELIGDIIINDNKDKIYYSTWEKEQQKVYLLTENEKKEIFSINNKKSLGLTENKIIFVDEENYLNIKNIINEEIYKIDVIVNDYFLILEDGENKTELFVSDKLILEDDNKMEEMKKQQNISPEDINKLKKCINEECEGRDYYDIGYKITLDKDGKFISKEYYIRIY